LRARIILAGFGHVGRAFARLLLERRADLTKVHGLDARVVGILTAHHGSIERAAGIDLRKALRLADAGASLGPLGRPVRGPPEDHVRRSRADVLVEVTPLRIAPRQPAVDHIVAALSSGKHVITANKGPVVYHYRRLRTLARRHHVGFRYEGTVMDGAPVFNLFQEALRGARIESFEGILNSTSNLVLSTIEAGGTYDDGVAAAGSKGLLETDPGMDLDGWDATVKACLLANVLMGGRLRPERVPREGISSLSRERIEAARASGARVKSIARGWRDGPTVKASLSNVAVSDGHPLFAVGGTSSSLVVRTDMLRELQIVEWNPTVRQTAYALYSDLLAIREGRLSPW
jgi:homoserine dehydrogenase